MKRALLIVAGATALAITGSLVSTLLLWVSLARARARLQKPEATDESQEAGDFGPDPVVESYRIARASAIIQ